MSGFTYLLTLPPLWKFVIYHSNEMIWQLLVGEVH